MTERERPSERFGKGRESETSSGHLLSVSPVNMRDPCQLPCSFDIPSLSSVRFSAKTEWHKQEVKELLETERDSYLIPTTSPWVYAYGPTGYRWIQSFMWAWICDSCTAHSICTNFPQSCCRKERRKENGLAELQKKNLELLQGCMPLQRCFYTKLWVSPQGIGQNLSILSSPSCLEDVKRASRRRVSMLLVCTESLMLFLFIGF